MFRQLFRPLARLFSSRRYPTTNDELVDYLKRSRVVRSPTVEKVLRAVDRKDFVLQPQYAYEDSPQQIGFNATISAPHMHAFALVKTLDITA